MENTVILNFNGSNYIKQSDLYICVVPFVFLITFYIHLGTEEDSCQRFLVPFLLHIGF